MDAAGQPMGVLDTDKRVPSLAFVLLDGRDAEVGALARYGIRHWVMRLDRFAGRRFGWTRVRNGCRLGSCRLPVRVV
ncbi:hypothetical protein Acsp03_00540 [Actinomadura sp. NBRC 104412]|nr:hypothetical protein Acsp03_00540 [Actinomadura sp. NBRC 104412]